MPKTTSAYARAVLAAVMVLVLTSGAAVRGGTTSHEAAPHSGGAPTADNWPTYGGNLYNQRYSALDRITTGNVRGLKAAWSYHTGTFSAATSFQSSPVVVDGVLYLTGPHSHVAALDARTGKELWQYVPHYDDLTKFPLCCGQVNRGVAVGGGKVFVAQLDAKLTALDQKTGGVLWSIPVGDPRQGYSETAAPLYHDGRVYIGVAGGEYEVHGYVSAYAAATGTMLWRFYTVPKPGEFGSATWPAGSSIWKHGGGGVWMTPVLDPELGLLYILVGNPSPDLDGAVRAGDNLFTDSIVALDMRTGQRRWHFQQVHHDIWDYDPASPTMLFDTNANGTPVKGAGRGRQDRLALRVESGHWRASRAHRGEARAPGSAPVYVRHPAVRGHSSLRAATVPSADRVLPAWRAVHPGQSWWCAGTLPQRQRRLGVVAPLL